MTKPQILQEQPKHTNNSAVENEKQESPIKTISKNQSLTLTDAVVQTVPTEIRKSYKLVQTDENSDTIDEMKDQIKSLNMKIDKITKQLYETMTLAQNRTEEILVLQNEKVTFESTLRKLKASIDQKDNLNEKLQYTIKDLSKQLNDYQMKQKTEPNQNKDSAIEENKTLLLTLKQLENDKNAIMVEYKELLSNEREEYAKSVKELQVKIMEMQSKLDR